VDISGTALARYDLATTDEQAAEQEARQYLERHQVIEVCPTTIGASRDLRGKSGAPN
jgi:hypothetical protein